MIQYIYTLGADLISQECNGKTYTYLYDGHGSVTALSDESGKITDTYSYDAFGNLLKSKGRTDNDYRYCGEQFDSTTGLYYLRARYMDTSTGRFISQDSYQGDNNDPITLHKYLYANSNPVMYSDPSGYMALAILLKNEASNVTFGLNILFALKNAVLGYVAMATVKYISSAALTQLAAYCTNLSECYRNAIVTDAINDISNNIKSPVLLKAINISYASLLHQVMSWVNSRGKTNNDYDNKYARHHIVPRGMRSTEISRMILLFVGIDCFTYDMNSPNIVYIKYSTHYALHSNNIIYAATVNNVICTAFISAEENDYLSQCANVRLALASLKSFISILDSIIA